MVLSPRSPQDLGVLAGLEGGRGERVESFARRTGVPGCRAIQPSETTTHRKMSQQFLVSSADVHGVYGSMYRVSGRRRPAWTPTDTPKREYLTNDLDLGLGARYRSSYQESSLTALRTAP
jgi:hypothetical protein